MQLDHKTVQKLDAIFRESWERVSSGAIPVCVPPYDATPDPSEIWSNYMNSHDVTILEMEDLLESFSDMVNFGRLLRESVCILDPAEDKSFLLVPFDLAERCLVMGALA